MPEMEHAFIARFGNKIVKGHTFTAVADVLAGEGFLMAQAERVADGKIKIPHENPRRSSARVEARFSPETNGNAVNGNAVKEPLSVEIAALEMTNAAVASGAAKPVGLQTRTCGAMHSDGVFCLKPVLYEEGRCEECGGDSETVYEHDGPHEFLDRDGVKYRWEEVLIIQDMPFNAYGPMDVEEVES